MIATVNTNLNVRVGSPSVNAPNYKYAKPGDQIEYSDILTGDSYEGNNLWLKGTDGNYYWIGGVSINPPQWMSDIGLPQIWGKATGRGVGVAVVDTGIDLANPDLPFDGNNFYVYDKGVSLRDNDDHGTQCAGLIGAKNRKGLLIGVAPGCNLKICKIDEYGYFDADADSARYAQAIMWCAEQDDVHVISISCATQIDDAAIIDDIRNAVNVAVNKRNKVVVCAAGDAGRPNDSSLMYPACVKDTIVVGAPSVKNVLYSYVNSFLATTVNGYEISSYGHSGKIAALSGTSPSNAIVAGVVALLIEQLKFNYTSALIKEYLKNASVKRDFDGCVLPILNRDKLLDYFKS